MADGHKPALTRILMGSLVRESKDCTRNDSVKQFSQSCAKDSMFMTSSRKPTPSGHFLKADHMTSMFRSVSCFSCIPAKPDKDLGILGSAQCPIKQMYVMTMLMDCQDKWGADKLQKPRLTTCYPQHNTGRHPPQGEGGGTTMMDSAKHVLQLLWALTYRIAKRMDDQTVGRAAE